MRIAYIISSLFSAGGMERVVCNKARCFTKMGHEVCLITTDQHNREDYFALPSSVKREDWDIDYDAYTGVGIGKKIRLFLTKNRLFTNRLHSFLQTYRPDVVVVMEDRWVPALVTDSFACVRVYESHFAKEATPSLRGDSYRHPLQRWMYRFKDKLFRHCYYPKLDAFVVLTEEDKRHWGERYKNIHVIPNSTDYQRDEGAALESRYAIAVGRLVEQKGFERLIEAWHIVHQSYPEWVLRLYGEGEEETALRSRIEQLRLTDRVQLLPPTPFIRERMAESSMVILSSRFEGFPMVMLEAMSAGLPVVSFDCPCGPKAMIASGENGYLVPEGDIRQLASAIIALIANPTERKQMGQRAKQSARAYSHEVVMPQWIALFKGLKKK